jgi:cell division protein FtsL
MTWPLFTVLALVAVSIIWTQRERRHMIAVSCVVVAAALGYAWLNLTKV